MKNLGIEVTQNIIIYPDTWDILTAKYIAIKQLL